MNGAVYDSDERTQVGKRRIAKETTIAVFVESDVNAGATAIKYTGRGESVVLEPRMDLLRE